MFIFFNESGIITPSIALARKKGAQWIERPRVLNSEISTYNSAICTSWCVTNNLELLCYMDCIVISRKGPC